MMMSVWTSIRAAKRVLAIASSTSSRRRLLLDVGSKRTQWHRFATVTPSKPLLNPIYRSNFVYNSHSSSAEIASETFFILFLCSVSVVLLFADETFTVVYTYFHPTHKKLEQGATFRVLILEPEQVTERDPEDLLSDIHTKELICSLKQVSSFQQEQYDALSYSWGPQSPSLEDAYGKDAHREPIKLNGRRIWVQPNLAAALYKLRYLKEKRTLWVDALCINQMDPLEKATQVPLMREIYANARQVIIWLGKESDSDGHAFEHLNWLFKLLDQQDDGLGMNHDELKNDPWWAKVKVENPDVFKSLVALLSRQWFRRTWVVQEVASSQTAMLKCGDDSIEWDVVSDVLTRLRHPSFALDHTEDITTQRSLANISAMENARRSVNGTFSLSLFEILLDTCSNDCTEPKDKIFAVLGLAKDWREKGGLVPDYRSRTTTEDIFKRFAMWDVKTNGKIRILSCVTGRDMLTNLPSWAPDWRKIRNLRPFVRYTGRTLFSASRDTRVDAWFSDHGQTLNTIGEVVDSVKVLPQHGKSVFASVNGGIGLLGLIYTWLKECQKLAANTQGRMTEDRFEQFWRTMTCGLTAEALPAPNLYGRYFMDYMKLIESKVRREIEGIAGIGTGRMGGISDSDFDGNFYGIMERHDDGDSDRAANALIEGSLNMWSSRRRFCTTSRGHLACVPEGAETGDLICILYGGEVPYVLRPQHNGYHVVVGECFVDGIMYGEAYSGQSSRAKHFRLV